MVGKMLVYYRIVNQITRGGSTQSVAAAGTRIRPADDAGHHSRISQYEWMLSGIYKKFVFRHSRIR